MKALHLRFFLITFMFLAFSTISFADSGGPLKPEQAAYDVTYYYLDLSIDPETQDHRWFLIVSSDHHQCHRYSFIRP